MSNSLRVSSRSAPSTVTMRVYLRPQGEGIAQDGILAEDDFAALMRDMSERASYRSELVGVIAVRIDDLEQITTAFGSDVGRSVTDTWRTGVRRHAPSNALVADDGPTGLLVGVLVGSPQEARRVAGVIYRGLFEDLGQVGGGVIPVVGVGVGLSDASGYDAPALVRVARVAATRAAETVETSVLVGDDE